MRIRFRDFFETLDECLETYHPNEDWREMTECVTILDGVGLIGVAYLKPYKDKEELGIVIRKEYQGQGRGEKAIQDILKKAKGTVIAKVFKKNLPMVHLMEKMGWEKYEDKLNFYMYKKTL
jgi:RimJ/RimL family protein N-acetyltransferase